MSAMYGMEPFPDRYACTTRSLVSSDIVTKPPKVSVRSL